VGRKISVGTSSGIEFPPDMGVWKIFFPTRGNEEWDLSGDKNEKYSLCPQPIPLSSLKITSR